MKPKFAVPWIGPSIIRRLLTMACWMGLWAALPAFAQFTSISLPDAAYTSGTTLVAITGADGASVGSVSNGVMTATLSTNMNIGTVGVSGWSTWNSPPNAETATPRVLSRITTLATQTITLSIPATTFGIEIEPNTFGAFPISVAYMNGATLLGTVTRSPNGNSGSLLFAASSTTPITSVVITATSGGNGYALAQFRYAALPVPPSVIPTLSEWGMIVLVLFMAGTAVFAMRSRRTRL